MNLVEKADGEFESMRGWIRKYFGGKKLFFFNRGKVFSFSSYVWTYLVVVLTSVWSNKNKYLANKQTNIWSRVAFCEDKF